MYSWQCTLLLVLFTLYVVQCRGSSGGAGSGGGKGSTSSSRKRRSSYNNVAVLAASTLLIGSSMRYNSASYYRYTNKNSPELCVACNGTASNATCLAQKTVCYQSSDCYYLTYNDGNSSLTSMGCLYEPYGSAGCEAETSACTDSGYDNCTCSFCEKGFCNSRSYSPTLSVMSLLALIAGLLCN